jgi:hypothetical protein
MMTRSSPELVGWLRGEVAAKGEGQQDEEEEGDEELAGDLV